MKKIFLSFLFSLSAFFIFGLINPSISLADTSSDFGDLGLEEVISLSNSLLPGEQVIYKESEKIEYNLLSDGTFEKVINRFNKAGTVGTLATISKSDLTVENHVMESYIHTSSGTSKGKRVFLTYQWNKKINGTKGDKISLAIPSGWSIDAGSYVCEEYSSGWPAGGSWAHQGSCGGGTYDLGFYGAVWSLGQTYSVWYKGNAGFRMTRTSSSAQNKVIGQYVRDVGKSTTWSIGYGPASVSVTGNKSADKVSWDTAFTY